MRETRLLMGMPITLEIVEPCAPDLIDRAFDYLAAVDRRFSTYRPDSEISAINRGRLAADGYSPAMLEVFALAEKTRWESHGFFDIRRPDGALDPSGIVKGWAIRNTARLLAEAGATDFFVDAGGDIQSRGRNAEGGQWSAGIRHPFDLRQIIRIVYPKGRGIATSGTYVRGQHIYNPHDPERALDEAVSLTVIGPDVLEADRFATAAFAMGRDGIDFLEGQSELEGYLVDAAGFATMTTGFEALTQP